MNLNFDTFLVALYTTIDDLYQQHIVSQKPNRPGHKPELSDSEVLTLIILAQWSNHSERWVIRHAHEHWRSYFPRLLSQSATNRRARDLSGALVHLVPLVAAQLEAHLAPYEILDSVAVPLMRQCRGQKHRLFAEEADVGVGGADKSFYYGCQLLLSVIPTGVVTGFLLGPASTNVRWLSEDLFCWRADKSGVPWNAHDLPAENWRKNGGIVGPRGPIRPRDAVGTRPDDLYITDGGFSGAAWSGHWQQDYGALVLTSQSYKGQGATAVKAQHRRWRHVVETVNSHLEGVFHLAFPGARTPWGLLTRIAAKVLAFNLAILLNRTLGRPDFAVATIFSF